MKFKLVRKTCIVCNTVKALEEFPTYKSRKGELMYKNQCKQCNSLYKKSHYHKNRQKYLDRSKSFRESNREAYLDYLHSYYRVNRETMLERAKVYNALHVEERRARWRKYKETEQGSLKTHTRRVTQYYISIGVLVRPKSCPVCGRKVYVEAHHNNYEDPLDVTWCCKRCHENIHHLNEGHDSCE